MTKKNGNMKKLKILVALSGGVDSSVATQLLVNDGHEVSAVFLRFWRDETENSASSNQAYIDAQAVAKKIGVPFFNLDLSVEFKKEVVDYFLKEYESGRTPNPCVACNKLIKIGLLLEKALALGYDGLATGHYLKTNKQTGLVSVFKAKDQIKDQSYFLYTLTQAQLNKLHFPLGDYQKSEVRRLAQEYDLETASKKESQDICFISGLHNDFLKKHLRLLVGEIKLRETGKTIGQHQGLALYTLGQRKGIEIGGSGPYYVVYKDMLTNTLWVSSSLDNSILSSQEFFVRDLNWLSDTALKQNLVCQVAIRYSQVPVTATVCPHEPGVVKVTLKQAIKAITSGQSAVFYDNEELLGGGIIDILKKI